jgi:hypothetical protein
MEHQPFENWILSGEKLSQSQLVELSNHLGICQHCQSVKEGIMGVEALLKSATFESPSPGFTNRFQYMAARRKEEAKRLQSYFFLGGILAITILVSIIYFAFLMVTQSPLDVIENLMTSAITLVSRVDELIFLLQTWVHFIPWPVTLALAAISASLVILLTSGWVISVWKVSARGVKVYE